MSTKGIKQTEKTKLKISLAKTEKTLEQFIEAWERYEKKLQDNDKLLPTIGGFCLEAGISQQNILDYTTKYSEVHEIINYITELQQEFLLTNGITQKINPIFSMFLLKSKHNFRDQPQQLTQNNYMNIAPEVLADALKLTAEKNDKAR